MYCLSSRVRPLPTSYLNTPAALHLLPHILWTVHWPLNCIAYLGVNPSRGRESVLASASTCVVQEASC